MKQEFSDFLQKHSLVLKKITENNEKLTFLFNGPEDTDEGALKDEVKAFFPFVDDIETHVQADSHVDFKARQKEILKQKAKEAHLTKKEPDKFNSCLIGKKISHDPDPISDIDFSDSVLEPDVTVEGEIFMVEVKDISQKSLLYTVAITDKTGSLYVKRFVPKKQNTLIDNFNKYLVKGNRIKAEGSLEYDEFLKERVLKPKNIVLCPVKERVDEEEDKRIELHLHTQYSSMDSVCKIDQIIDKVEAFGHDAIGITDHGVLQAYPELQRAAKGKDIKIVYGMEGFMIDTDTNIVTGSKDQSFEDEIVFFDLETTGTSIYKDKVIEIAAAVLKDGEITQTFQRFVNPGEKLKPKIIELTGITDEELLAKGVSLDQGFGEFLEFVDGRVLAAHNASFDTAFLKRWLDEKDKPFDFTYIDTLPMARILVPEISRFNMGRLCSFFKIKNKRAHRAIEDSIASAKVLNELYKRASAKGLSRIHQLNTLVNPEEIAAKTSHANHLTIYVKDQQGLKDLYELVSDSHLKYFNKRPLIPRELLKAKRDHLILGSGCARGELFEKIREGAPKDVLEDTAKFYDFLEVQPVDNNRTLFGTDLERAENTLKRINKTIVELGDKLNIPVVATGDVHFLDPDDGDYLEMLRKSVGKKGTQLPQYFRTTKEMLGCFNFLPEQKARQIVIDNPRKIVNMVEEIKPIPDGTFPPVIEGAEDEIREMVKTKARAVYGENLPEIVKDRIERELHSIIENGYSVLYLIAQKLVKHSQDQGYLVGSRGSVGSSFIAWLCGITEVNALAPHYNCPKCHYTEFSDKTDLVGPDLPDKNCPNCGTKLNKDGFDIPFETFLGFEGDKEPDIDLNFSGENQGEAHRYTEELFGQGKTFRAGTISTIADNTAYGFAKNYFDEMGKYVSKAELERYKEAVKGVKRTTGQHPGGIMVVPKDKEIYEFTPIQHPADDASSDVVTTHFAYESLSGRLLKLDILGHDDPTMLRKLQLLTGVDPKSIPLDDKDVLSLFTGTEALHFKEKCPIKLGTNGIPEFGTSFVRQMVKEIKPTAFIDLIRISGLSHGTDVWNHNAQDLIKKGVASIKQVICLRDDIMLDLLKYGLKPIDSFTIMEGVRKGRGLTPQQEKTMKEKGVPNWYIDSCKKISYMFPKAHAVAYIIMAYRIAWYKIHYPLAYYACYFGIRAKEFDLKVIKDGKEAINEEIARLNRLAKNGALSNKEAQSLTSLELALEMYSRGFSCQNIDLKKSHSRDFLIEGDSLIPPFITVNGLGDNAAEDLYELLHNGEEIISQDQLLSSSKITKANLETLNELGCLNNLPKSNQVAFF